MGRKRNEDQAPASPLISEFAAHLKLEVGAAVGTARAYPADLLQFAHWLGALQPAEIDRELAGVAASHVRRWVMHLMEGERTEQEQAQRNRLVSRKLSALRSFFRLQKREGRRSDDPTAEVKRPRVTRGLPHVLSVVEVQGLLNTKADSGPEWQRLRNITIMEMLYGSGVRRSELVRLNVDDVDAERRVARVFGKRRKVRQVFLSTPAAEALEKYLGVRPASEETALFLSREHRRLSDRQLYTIFRDRKRRSGITKRATPHTMRHSFATHMIENGADLITVKELLGHESVATTQIYTNVSLEHMRRTYEKSHPSEKD
jgi:integrase/recombinase XerD